MRVDAGERLAGLAVAEQARGTDRRVHGEATEEFAADVAGSAKDGRSNHQAPAYRGICMFMQVHA
jgi:hypothetical protein